MRKTAVRALSATLGIPALAACAAVVVRGALAGRFPDPLAVHWGPGGDADRSASLTGLTVGSLVAAAVLAIIGSGLALLAVTKDRGLSRGVVTFEAWFAALPSLLLVATLIVNLDAPAWNHVAGGWLVLVLLLGLSALTAGLAALVAGPGVRPTAQTPPSPEGPSVGLEPGQRASWLGGTTSFVAAATIVPVVLLLFGIETVSGTPVPIVAYLIVLGTGLVLGLVMSRLGVVVNENGVTIRFGILGFPRRHVPLSDIASADTGSLGFWSLGGFGIRANPATGTMAYKLRGGPALKLTLRGGQVVWATVDRPEQAAGLINDLLRRESPQPSQ
ncbi:hypothetical protein BAY61_02585 [Prauserella marina]|uniref:Uncharacterized protein n=1 Tax=Prauserella marina TaxID=530584 RepID=A0A222VJG6_9PSEU|nr:hypothetical protein [Prauserella marina]ASR34055.1 hypothetical protein BAY61_02585 [Prauserella marina]PWV82691.1 hypothetical protein DES30_102937 [Prauserella marina]SDC74856.1 hypothetical protein SAMN05421630_103473 [Prauserella marina]